MQIREADWDRLLPKLAGVKTVYICQDNEVSEAGMNGAMRTARILAENGILTRLAVLPLGEKQQLARRELRERFGVEGSVTPRELAKLWKAKARTRSSKPSPCWPTPRLTSTSISPPGKTATDFEDILAAAQTPLELAISKLGTDIPDADLSRLLEPILSEVGRLDPIEQDRYLRLIQARCGKRRLPVATLRKQLKVVEIGRGPQLVAVDRRPSGGAQPVPIDRTEPAPLPEDPGQQPAVARRDQ